MRAEVEREHAIRGTDARLAVDQRGLDELVRLSARVCLAHGLLAGVRLKGGLAVHQQVVHALGAVPAAVAIHRPVAPHDRAHARPLGDVELGQEAGSRVRQRVAPVGERVHHEVRHRQRARELDQRAQVRERGVHATVGHQPQQVHARSVRQRGAQHVVVRQAAGGGPGGDRVVYAYQVLAHDRARTEVQVAHLGVAHLPVGQAHRASARLQRGVRIRAPQVVEHRRARQRHGIARRGLGQPPPVEHDQARARNRQARGSRG